MERAPEIQNGIGGSAATQEWKSAILDRERPLVLVVEDNPHDWEIYGNVLFYNGYDVMYASDGELGYRLAQEHHPDLILLDLRMPKLDGLTLCARLREDRSRAHIPVVVLSGYPKREFGPRAEAAGCARYLEKPTKPVEVLHEVEALIGRPPAPGVGRPPLQHLSIV